MQGDNSREAATHMWSAYLVMTVSSRMPPASLVISDKRASPYGAVRAITSQIAVTNSTSRRVHSSASNTHRWAGCGVNRA